MAPPESLEGHDAAPEAIAGLARRWEASEPEERLVRLTESLSGRFVFTTSFGLEDQLIAHWIFERRLPVEVVTIDTGRLFPATYKVWQETEERYGTRIRSVHPDADRVAAQVADAGVNGFYLSKEARLGCCAVRKVEPLACLLAGASVWLTGLRADQSAARGGLTLAAWDEARRLVKFAPLFDRSRDQIASQCAALGVPLNPLHEQGFLSIGCEPCTRAVRPGEPERSGRWWWESEGPRECGLHVAADGRLARKAVAV